MRESTDIWFSSFLTEVKGIELQDYVVIGRGKGRFFFELDDVEWKKYKLEYSKSDVAKIKQGQEKLKDLLY